jgi:hypothetical protein
MRHTVIVDLDGTLADVGHRRHLVTGAKRDYKRFHELCAFDPPNEWCVSLVKALREAGYRIVLLSGRSQAVERQTLEWLEKHLGTLDNLQLVLLRPERDYTPDVALKRRWVERYGVERILMAVDDRQRVVDMFRSLGIPCLQCSDWDDAPRMRTLPQA